MLATINLDDQFCLVTDEIDDVASNQRLPPEMCGTYCAA